MKLSYRSTVLGASLFLAAIAMTGCDKPEPVAEKKASPATQPVIPIAQMNDWCPEHGMPESICVQCNASLAAGFKAKNDWCEAHGLPDSQCFVHHPELKEKFALAFKEKYGKEAPSK